MPRKKITSSTDEQPTSIGALQKFAQTAEAVAATTKKLEKAASL